MPRLGGLRFYGLGHRYITEIAEAGVPEGVVRTQKGASLRGVRTQTKSQRGFRRLASKGR